MPCAPTWPGRRTPLGPFLGPVFARWGAVAPLPDATEPDAPDAAPRLPLARLAEETRAGAGADTAATAGCAALGAAAGFLGFGGRPRLRPGAAAFVRGLRAAATPSEPLGPDPDADPDPEPEASSISA